MSIRKSPRGQWMIDVKIRMPDGSITRVRKVCPVQTKHAMIEWWGPVLKEYYAGSEGNVRRLYQLARQTTATGQSAP